MIVFSLNKCVVDVSFVVCLVFSYNGDCKTVCGVDTLEPNNSKNIHLSLKNRFRSIAEGSPFKKQWFMARKFYNHISQTKPQYREERHGNFKLLPFKVCDRLSVL